MKFRILIIFLTILLSCKQDELPTEPDGYRYTGMIVGSYRIYEIEDITFSLIDVNDYIIIGDSDVVYKCTASNCSIDTNISYVKEVVDRKILDQEGDSVFVIERYYSDTQEWEEYPDSVWTSKYEKNQYLRTENNQRYAKLVFPITAVSNWDYNAHNAYEIDDTRYSGIRVKDTIDGIAYEDVVIVEKEYNTLEDDDLVVNDVFAEKYYVDREYYSSGVGLIFKEYIYFKNCQENGAFCSDNVFLIAEGRQIIEKLIVYEL